MHWLITFVTWWWWQNYHLFCLLSLQKLEVKSYGALSREVQKQAWPWKWGTGWLDKQAENLPTAAWTATAQKESEWCWQGGGLLHTSLEPAFSPPLCVSINANSHALWHWFNFHWLICCEENFCLPATEKCDTPGFYISGNRFGDKVFHFKGKMLKHNCHKGKFALPWNNT